jgi:hypothetical protein
MCFEPRSEPFGRRRDDIGFVGCVLAQSVIDVHGGHLATRGARENEQRE